MANKLKVYQIEDTQTGEIIKIEGPEGATDEELYSFLEQSQQAPASQATPSVGISDANTPEAAPASPDRQEVITQLQRGYTSDEQKADPRFLGEAGEAEYMQKAADPNVSYQELNDWVRAKAREAGQVPPAEVIIGGEAALKKYREDLASGKESAGVSYDQSKDFMMPEKIKGVAQSDSEFIRGIQQGATEGGAYLVGDRVVDWLDMNNDKMRQLYPDATDEEIEAITDSYNAEMTKRIRAATAEQTKDDGWIANTGGQVLGSVGPEAAIPVFGARTAAGRIAQAAFLEGGTDVGYQAYDINRGVQSEFDTQRALLAPVVGAAFQGALEVPMGIARGLDNRKTAQQATASPSDAPTVRVPVARKGSKKYAEQIEASRSDVEAEIARTTEGWQNPPDVEVRTNFKDLDGIDDNSIGVYTGEGKIAINTEAVIKQAKRMKVEPQDIVRAVTFHESLGHYGLARKFGDELDDILLNWYDSSVGDSFKKRVDQWIVDNPKAYKNYEGRPDALARVAEEVLADMSNKGQIDVTLYDRIANLVKDMLRAMGRDVKVSEREIRSILALSHATVGKKQRLAFGDLGSDPGAVGPRYMYLGRHAEGADLSTLERLEEEYTFDKMSGVSEQDLVDDYGPGSRTRQETGWFKAPDGQWRFEINDNDMELRSFPQTIEMGSDERGFIEAMAEKTELPEWEVIQDVEGRSLFDLIADPVIQKKYDMSGALLGDLIDHPKLFEAYPDLADILVTRHKKSSRGEFNPVDKTINISPGTDRPDGILLHEIQHWVQDEEGMAQGGNLESALKVAPPELLIKGTRNYLYHLRNKIRKEEEMVQVAKKIYQDPRSRRLYKMRNQIEALDQKTQSRIAREEVKKKAQDEKISIFREANNLRDEIVESYFGMSYGDLLRDTPMAREWVDIDHALHSADRYSRKSASVRLQEMARRPLYKIREATTLLKLVDANDGEGLRQALRYNEDAKFSLYEHLFGEVEARDTQNRYDFAKESIEQGLTNLTSARLREINDPYTTESDIIEPDDYIFDYGNRAASESRAMNPSQLEGISGDARLSEDDLFEVQNTNRILTSVLEGYEPTVQSWDEAKTMARNSGLNSGHIRKAKGVGDLDKKMFQYDAVAQKMSEKLAELGARLANGDLSAKGDYLHTLFKFNEVVGTIFNDQASIARALNAMKAIQTTRRQYGELNRVLSEYENNNMLGAFADENTFNDFVKYMNQMLANGNTVGAATAARQIVKPYWWQYILSFRHAMMLSGLGTHAKNALDNTMMIARELEESAMAMVGDPIRKALRAMGFQAQDGVSPQEVAARTYGLIRAALDSATYLDTARAFKEGHGTTPYSAKIEMQDAYIPGIGKVNSALFAADTFFRAFHKNANLYALGVRQARADGFKGAALFQEGSARAYSPDEAMINAAKKKTDEALLVDTPSGWASKLEAMKAIKPNMSGGEQATAFVANVLLPFFRVTDRLLFQAIRRSPLSFLDKNTREAFRAGGAERDIAIARTAYGTALMAYYWMSAGDEEEGIVGQTSRDYKKIQALEAGGYKQNAVREDGQYVDATALNLSFNPLDLQNNVAANVASIREAWERGDADEKDTVAALGAASMAFLSFLGSQSYAENLSATLGLLDSSESETQAETRAANFIGGLGSQFVPALMRQANQQVLDPIKRDTRGDKGFVDRVTGRITSGIPGLSERLPTKYDLYGDVIPQGRSTFAINNYADIKDDPVSVELQKLERTTDKPVITGFPGYFKFEGETIKLEADGIQEWNRRQGYYLRELMAETIRSPEWKTMSTEERIAKVKSEKEVAYEYAKEDMLPLLGLTEGNDE